MLDWHQVILTDYRSSNSDHCRQAVHPPGDAFCLLPLLYMPCLVIMMVPCRACNQDYVLGPACNRLQPAVTLLHSMHLLTRPQFLTLHGSSGANAANICFVSGHRKKYNYVLISYCKLIYAFHRRFYCARAITCLLFFNHQASIFTTTPLHQISRNTAPLSSGVPEMYLLQAHHQRCK